MKAGRHLYVGARTVIGGGGAMGPHARLTIGDGSAIVDDCFVNLSDQVTIGSRTALSSRVTILTHGFWQSVLEGYPASYAPVSIGSDVVLYVGTTVLPGCNVGDGASVGAHSLVTGHVPRHSLVAGSPARVLREPYPPVLTHEQRLCRLKDILRRYAATLAYKGFTDVQEDVAAGEVRGRFDNTNYRIRIGLPAPTGDEISIGLTLEPAPRTPANRSAVFDLTIPAIHGYRDRVVEDLRDHLRRAGIRILDDYPFRTLPPKGLETIPSFD
jgi:acetyltransferase-like isoleucine patch superfamily enzyme